MNNEPETTQPNEAAAAAEPITSETELPGTASTETELAPEVPSGVGQAGGEAPATEPLPYLPEQSGFRAVSTAPNEFEIHHNGRNMRGMKLTPQDSHIVLAWLKSLPEGGA